MSRHEFDPAKSERNARERGLPFGRVADFDWQSAIVVADTRRDYGETRLVATGLLDGRLHVLCFSRIKDGGDQPAQGEQTRGHGLWPNESR